jgi:hypothetical protein
MRPVALVALTLAVRRCERRIGELVREGQRDGAIAGRGQGRSKRLHSGEVVSPLAATGLKSPSQVDKHYAIGRRDRIRWPQPTTMGGSPS